MSEPQNPAYMAHPLLFNNLRATWRLPHNTTSHFLRSPLAT